MQHTGRHNDLFLGEFKGNTVNFTSICTAIYHSNSKPIIQSHSKIEEHEAWHLPVVSFLYVNTLAFIDDRPEIVGLG
jgi:hypothetical protein